LVWRRGSDTCQSQKEGKNLINSQKRKGPTRKGKVLKNNALKEAANVKIGGEKRGSYIRILQLISEA